MSAYKDVTPFSGIQTFLGRDHAHSLSGNEDVAVLGIPIDSGVSYMPGARLGPSGIRRASMIYKFYSVNDGLLDILRGKAILRNVKIVDLGDIDVPFGDQKEAMNTIYRKVLSLFSRNIKVFRLFLGGDHSVTFPLVKAVKDSYGDIGLIQIDAHLDMLSSYIGNAYTHGSPILRCIDEAGIKPNKVFQIGMRGFLNSHESLRSANKLGTTMFTMREVKRLGIESIVCKIGEKVKNTPIYLTFDIDAMDPSIAPGTGIPEPGGFSHDEALELIDSLFSSLNIVAMDVVEVSPLLDINDITSKLAISIILEALGVKFSIYQNKLSL